ncbi:DoxX family protein [Thalassotalea sp. HSM 43]|uniref:HvfX family Cu-binding RiPP maturation protein n=1 Tax=Thalassotalea sp. HSM 43 TaxID=2552945 RepID=UPI00108041EE|nr:DoxX family protein [Thalassotalea sp. HSM 43]QBY06045.1 DoxX family protein [Thalassotalea sp. HSM 43]
MIATYNKAVDSILKLDAIPALLMRVFLAPVFIIAGYNKMQFSNPDLAIIEQIMADPNVVEWFGNSEWGLGLPYAEVLANAAAWTEFFGGWLLLIGLATRLVSIPLMFTMIVAATTVHLEQGWYAVAPTNPDTSSAKVFSWLGFESADESLANSVEASKRLTRIRDIVEENGNTDWLYETGNVVVLNNGIEFASTYFIMLLALFFVGPGRYVSLDYWLFTDDIKKQPDTQS